MNKSETRFMQSLIPQPDGCWQCPGYKTINGYSKGYVQGYGSRFAHRLAWEIVNGAVPAGLVLDHLCRNRWCCNPAHLEAVTQRQNARRSPLLGKVKRGGGTGRRNPTHCPYGHPYDEKNTYVQPNGGKACRACNVRRVLERRDRLKRSASL